MFRISVMFSLSVSSHTRGVESASVFTWALLCVEQLIVKVQMTDGSTKTLMVDERQTVRDVLDNLFEKTHCDGNVDWCVSETNPELQTGETDRHARTETRPVYLSCGDLVLTCRSIRVTLHLDLTLCFYLWNLCRSIRACHHVGKRSTLISGIVYEQICLPSAVLLFFNELHRSLWSVVCVARVTSSYKRRLFVLLGEESDHTDRPKSDSHASEDIYILNHDQMSKSLKISEWQVFCVFFFLMVSEEVAKP